MRADVRKAWLVTAPFARRIPGGARDGDDLASCRRRERHRCRALALIFAVLLAACSGSSVDSRLADGKRLFENQDRKGAEIQFKSVLAEQPQNAEARFLLGKLRFEAWDFAGAESELRRAWDAGYDANQIAPLLARSFLELGQPEKVLSEINPATLTNPAARALLDTYRARAQLARGYVDEAKAMNDAVLRTHPDLAAALVTQAQVRMHGQDMNTAAQFVDGVLAKYPRDVDALILRARVAGIQGQYAIAQARLGDAVAAAPAAVWPRLALVALLFAGERYDEVRQQVAVLREIPGGELEASLFEAQLALQEKKYEEARDAVAQVLKVMPNHVRALLAAGKIELAIGSPELAETHLAKVVDSSPKDPQARRLLADARLRLGKPEAAIAALEPVLQSESADPLSLALAGQIEMQRGEYRRARQFFKQAAEADPHDGRLQAALAEAQIRSGDVAAGISSLRELGASNDTQYLSEVMLVLTYLEQGAPDEALKAVEALAVKQPRNPLTANLRGIVLLRKRDNRGARQAFEAAAAVDPLFVPAVMNLVNLDVSEGNTEDARKRLEGLLVRQPGNANALLALAELKAR
ncbi:MAG: PEP-CTERM system TPR-repeat protein PrsT, partial [Candidatus Accumulibacter sp.]|nr:PEP-CTERM system TPR-repeat protein PrsT [Accumulibacter sp.]